MDEEKNFPVSFKIPYKLIKGGDLNSIVSAIKSFLEESISVDFFSRDFLDKLIASFISKGALDIYEESFIIPVDIEEPHKILSDLNLLAVDGSSLVFKGHPVRLIIARSGVYSHSQRLTNVLRVNGVYMSTVRLVDEYPSFIDLDDVLRRFESETLAFVESKTIIDIVEKNDGKDIDFILHDGPLYFHHGFKYTYEAVQVLYDFGVPIIGLVKNSYSRLIADLMGLRNILDSDILSYHLPNGARSAFFINKISNQYVVSDDLQVVSAYYMTPKGNLLRIDVPYWVFESYGARKLMEIIAADVMMGGGNTSYLVSMADKKAKFSDYEKKSILEALRKLIYGSGFNDEFFYNHKRWGFHSLFR